MAGEWDTVPLDRLIEPGRGISYGIVQPGAPVPSGVPIVRVGDLRDGTISVSAPLRVAPSVEAAYARTRLTGGELLLTIVGTVGEAAVVPMTLAGWNVARAVAVIPVRKEVGAYWVKLALAAPGVREIIDSRLNTTVQATLNLRDVAQLPIALPPAREREAIAQILGTLDDKIEINLRMNDTLDAIARALFNSWFVDFDPVRAKASGELPSAICRRLRLSPDLLALFPDRLVESELGEIPEGWQVKPLDEIATYLNGLALQKYPPESETEWLPVIKIAQLKSGSTVGADRAAHRLAPDYVVEDGDVLFSWSGSLEVDVWCGGRGALNQHLFKVTSEGFPKWFFFLWTRQHLPHFRTIAAGKAVTMGHIQRRHVTEALCVVPSGALLHAADMTLAPILQALIENRRQARTLATARDALLPKLLSGELRVPLEGAA